MSGRVAWIQIAPVKGLALQEIDMALSKGHGEQHLETLSEHFIARVAEQLFGFVVHNFNQPLVVDADDGLRGGFHERPKLDLTIGVDARLQRAACSGYPVSGRSAMLSAAAPPRNT